MPFEPLQLARQSGKSLTIDKQHRIRLSATMRQELALTTFTPVVISVDVENKRVGVVKQELAKIPNASVVRPDKRGYLGVAAGKLVVSKLALADADLPLKFEYVGKIDEGSVFWHSFQLVRDVR
ncbi:hypothetical protein COJ96_05875 [Bacillus sp. AFS073361]|uniref:hypothetical protein n=1 Tax=Bacillus sp. AFS073361 TaxID=2033511 RepID=UPI000BF5B562|nr:hypothetical protein [Bacillus sp. AFS073361]PFP30239.1 hypothetical protein COJ96_05875 [Bacillus sp. AFS073361]